jgi:alkanesulfonate monooxygenase SsuD/methylene tetrahydromethanopterin reductase-like flavin-dependent oxidoreductase (luciferase family)
MRVCLMIEGQESVSWEDWLGLAKACEESPIDALFRSDHYLSVMGRADRGSLDAWATIAGLAAITSSGLKIGTMVSPATFRHPSVLAKNVVTADHIAGGGRIELGMGAGWLEAEHAAFGFPFPPLGERFELLEEQIEIVRREWEEDGLTFEGRHYTLSGNALPKPLSRPNLIVGGRARPRSLRLAARWADEYNLVMMTAEQCAEAVPLVRRAWQEATRPEPVISLMTSCIIGSDEVDLLERAHAVAEVRGDDATDPEAYLEAERPNSLVGTVAQIRQQLAELEEVGVERVMLQYLPHRDLDGVGYVAELAET